MARKHNSGLSSENQIAMSVRRVQSAVRSRGQKRIRHGHRFVAIFTVHPRNIFVLNEDLLCSSSKHFKKISQRNRKPIEGNCGICLEDMSGLAAVNYCEACGQNLHADCIYVWLLSNQRCSWCRGRWVLPLADLSRVKNPVLTRDYDPSHLDHYIQWLYTGIIPNYTNDSGDSGVKNHWSVLLACYVLGEHLKDQSFQEDIRDEFVGDEKSLAFITRHDIIASMYQTTTGTSIIAKLLVDIYSTHGSTDGQQSLLPRQFILDLAQFAKSQRTSNETAHQATLARPPPELIENFRDPARSELILHL